MKSLTDHEVQCFNQYLLHSVIAGISQRRLSETESDSQIERDFDFLKERALVNKAIFTALKEILIGKSSLTDIMSGEAVATVPLVMSGRLDKLCLVDGGFQDPPARTPRMINYFAPEMTAGIEFSEARIINGASRLPFPKDYDYLLANTRLIIPPNKRVDMNVNTVISPATFRTSYLLNHSLTFADILRSVGDKKGTRLHITDLPFSELSLSSSKMREYVQGFLDEAPGWKIIAWTELIPEYGLCFATLEHE